jgi:carboxylesterase type B
MDEDIVLVLVNYRLGPFGFLSTGDDVIPGNNGLKDQNQALRWVQANIARFGGNPKSVTIFGNSAGGASVNYHILSNSSTGLFHAAISQSGSALNPWAFSPYPANMARKFGEAVGCPTKSSRGLLNCLLGKSTKELIGGMKSLVEWGYDPFTPFGPVIEPKIPGAFLTAHPKKLLENGNFNRVPWIVGLNQDEGHMMHSAFILANPELSADLKENWKEIFPVTLQFNNVYYKFPPSVQTKMAEKIYSYYFGNKSIDTNSRQELTDVFSDRFFNQGVKKAMVLASAYTKVYPYMFTHNRGDYTLLQVLHIEGNYGVSHADELTFLFSDFHGDAPEFKKGSASEQVSKNLVKLWASFARDKKPTALWGSQKEWKPIEASKSQADKRIIQYYRLDSDTALVPEHFTKRVAFWESLLADAAKQSKIIDGEAKKEL